MLRSAKVEAVSSVASHVKDCVSVAVTGCVVVSVQSPCVFLLFDHHALFDRRVLDGETGLQTHVCLFSSCDVRPVASCDCIPRVVDRVQASLCVCPNPFSLYFLSSAEPSRVAGIEHE